MWTIIRKELTANLLSLRFILIFLDELPALDFQEASLSESWNSVSVDLLSLFLLVACFFMIAYLGFVRSDVR